VWRQESTRGGADGSAPQVLFRSINKLLMDTATSEYLFCREFFQEDAVFQELFAPTLAAVEATLQQKAHVRQPHRAPG
jgi:Vps52 / Sac2 family